MKGEADAFKPVESGIAFSVRRAMSHADDVSNLKINETSDGSLANIRFGINDKAANAYAFFPSAVSHLKCIT